MSTHADDQDYDKYKKVPVQWSGSEAWQLDLRTPVVEQKYTEKNKSKYSTQELNTNPAESFEAAVGSAELGVMVYGDPLVDTSTSNGGSSSGGGGGGGGGYDLATEFDWMKWAPAAVGGVLVLFLVSRYAKG